MVKMDIDNSQAFQIVLKLGILNGLELLFHIPVLILKEKWLRNEAQCPIEVIIKNLYR